MIDFSELLDEAEGKPVNYKGKDIIRADKIRIEKKFKAEIELISVNSQWRQGIRFSTEGEIDVGDNLIGSSHIFWQELWTEMNSGAIEVTGKSKNGILLMYNSWDWGKGTEAWVCNAAMIKETVGKNEYIYNCNDGDWDDDFNDLIFRVEILEGGTD